MKTCTKCGIEKQFNEFSKDSNLKSGLKSACKICRGLESKEWSRSNKGYIKNKNRENYLENTEKLKIKSNLYKQTYKEEEKIRNQKWHEDNKEQEKIKNKIWAEENKEYISIKGKIYREEHKEERRVVNKIWTKNNPEKCNSNLAKRRATKLDATPEDLTKEDWQQIDEFYKEAKRLEKSDGIKRHVDHIVPLQGEIISGQHAPWNLRVITAEENRKKSNKITKEIENIFYVIGLILLKNTFANPSPSDAFKSFQSISESSVKQ